MNYRHSFHAGNFADVVKHATLVRILLYLARKPAPFRVIDTHAGAGWYDLDGDDATRTGEWRGGVARLDAVSPASPAGVLLAPYRALLDAADVATLARYPGSPLIARALMRADDRSAFCETQPEVGAALRDAVRRDPRCKVLALDGWTALRAFVPPPERRGVVLIDPPFESPDEWDKLAGNFMEALRKWRTGVFVLWYPVKSFATRDSFLARLAGGVAAPCLRVEFGIAPVEPGGALTRAGLLVCNPPYPLADELRVLLPALAVALGRDGEDASRLWSVEGFA